ncbi:hypothetical protein PoHVEF18_002786 [Penicillium ochrochloron]
MPSTREEKDSSDDPGRDQTWFLINVIMHTESKKLEKVNWATLANQLGISKEAAAKRYERLLKSYGLNRSYQAKDGAESADGIGPPTPGPKTPTPKKKRAPKRKRSELEAEEAKEVLDEA